MKQLNFKELNVEVEIDNFQKADIAHEVGNSLHRLSESIPMSDLARKIYYSEGAVEIDDSDFAQMLSLLKNAFKRFVLDAIEKNAVEV